MEEIMKTQRPTTPSTMREESHSISKPKPKPKIRIVHIFAPEIIKTDAANFRELVQRLTGKPTKRIGSKKIKKVRNQVIATRENLEEEINYNEKEMWMLEETINVNPGGYLSGLSDVEGFFFQGFNEFNQMSSTSHMDHSLIGEAQVKQVELREI